MCVVPTYNANYFDLLNSRKIQALFILILNVYECQESEQTDTMNELEDVRKAAENFVRERDWEKFHSPCNILLALCGEVGEIAECFQWKGNLDNGVVACEPGDSKNAQAAFTPAEVVHVGEEVADVMIYLTRLSDVMRLDLAAAVSNLIRATHGKNGQREPAVSVHMEEGCGWSSCIIADLHAHAAEQCVHRSPRRYSFKLMTAAGKLTSLFASRPEGECSVPCQQWVDRDFTAAAEVIAEVAVLCAATANAFALDVGQVIARKFERNAAKYPAQTVRGSSAKYTAYAAAKATGEESGGAVALALLAGAALGFLLARRG